MLQFSKKKKGSSKTTTKRIPIAKTALESASLHASEKESLPENNLNIMLSSTNLLEIETEVSTKSSKVEDIHQPSSSSWEDIDVTRSIAYQTSLEKISSESREVSWEDMHLEEWEQTETDTSTNAYTIDECAPDTDTTASCAATRSTSTLPSYSKSKASKETTNLKLLSDLSCLRKLSKKPPTNRMSQFVMLLGNPDVPRKHPGVDDTYHPKKDIDLEWKDLLERGMTTLKYINHKNRVFKGACSNTIFLRTPISKEDDALTKRIHTGHTLDFYKASIQNEKQLPIEFHFAGHGNAETIGPMSSDKRLTPDVVAELFDYIAQSCDLADTLKGKKHLIFNFHVCNAAYIDVSDCVTDDDIQTKLLNQSVIGKFYQQMIALGYTNITVIGYRGFYQGMTNGSNSFVTNTIQSNPSKLELPINKVTYSIERKGQENVFSLPKTDLGKRFPVDLEPIRNGQQLRHI